MAFRGVYLVVSLPVLAFLAGCESTGSGESNLSNDPLLTDPYGYKVNFPDDNSDNSKIHKLDQPGLKRDIDRVFNP